MDKITPEEMDALVARGVALFKAGYNCSQSVVGAFAHLYGLPHDVAMKMSASLGGGTARMRLTCGAANGMFLLAGFENGCTEPAKPVERAKNYRLVQQFAERFKAENGSLSCAELLGLRAGKAESPTPSERTAEYYKSRPCAAKVESAARIFAEYLMAKE